MHTEVHFAIRVVRTLAGYRLKFVKAGFQSFAYTACMPSPIVS